MHKPNVLWLRNRTDSTFLCHLQVSHCLPGLDCWIERGPPNARYSCYKSGWFTNDTFEDWLMKVFLPVAENKEVTALISNNLSSQFSEDGLRLCRKYNVKFMALSSNSTDTTQPIDVAFFRPLKIKWCKILNDWKTNHLKESSVPKTVFPRLLKD